MSEPKALLDFIALVNARCVGKDKVRSNYRRNLLRSRLPTFVEDLSTARLADAWERLREIGKTPGSLRRTFAAFGPVLKLIREHTGRNIAMPTFAAPGRKRRDYLSRDDWEALRAELPEAEATMAMFLLKTGMRLGEAFSVREDCLVGDTIRLMDTKNGLPRFVPWPDGVLNSFIGSYLAFPGNREKFQRAFRTAARKLFPGREIVVHTLRHTCASWLVEKDVPISVVADYLGHKDLQTTRRYAHVATSTLRAAMTKVF